MTHSTMIKSLLIAATLFHLGCKERVDSAKGLPSSTTNSVEGEKDPCTFTIDGKEFSGRVSTQLFPATKEYSVLCHSTDESAKLIQFVFRDESSARTNQEFKIVYDSVMEAEAGSEVSLSFDNVYSSNDASGGSVRVTKTANQNSVEFKDIALERISKEHVQVSGKIPF